MSRTAAIIVAAGRGTRAGGEIAKQWQSLAGRRVLDWTVDAIRAAGGIDLLVLVLHPDEIERAEDFGDVLAVIGGPTRSASVRNGLEALAGRDVARVLIHDAARPLVTPRIVSDVRAALDAAPGAAPALAVTDALWTGADGRVTGARDRSGLFRAQTPQGFHFDGILAAHRAFEGEAADDVEVARAAGLEVVMVAGDERNIKITTRADFARAEAMLETRMDIRMGNGFDVHRFGEGNSVILCGVEIPFEKGLLGHSDADVGMHAVTDALYGALALGDIGRHFPPSDPQWKGAASEIFLRHAVEQVTGRGYAITSVDVTLICERPKIGPHAAAMTERMAVILGMEPGRVSIKATTTERLGFPGREEGIAALATACVVRA